jgi:hypothetical protein
MKISNLRTYYLEIWNNPGIGIFNKDSKNFAAGVFSL